MRVFVVEDEIAEGRIGDKSAGAVLALDDARWRVQPPRAVDRGIARLRIVRAMRAVRVVVVDTNAERVLEVAAVHDQDPVEALGADCGGETLAQCVRLRRSHRCLDDLEAFACEHGIEIASELAVAIADQELKRSRPLLERRDELASLLNDPRPGRLAVQPARSMPAAAELDQEEHLQPLQRDRLDGEEIDREHALRLHA